jgi:hypothetical protein
MKKRLFAAILVGFLIWSLTPPNPMGTYVARHHKNTMDTIVILNGGIYKQSIYRRVDGKEVFHNEGKWFYKRGNICLSNFFQSDDISRTDNYDYAIVLLTFSTPLERNFLGQPVFDYDEETSMYRYYKVVW